MNLSFSQSLKQLQVKPTVYLPTRRPVHKRAQSETQEVGTKVAQWLTSPYDALTFGPRFTIGSLLSLPNTIQGLPQDVERLVKLLQDDRPLEDKQKIVLQELEARVASNLEQGAFVEEDVMNNIRTMLPSELVSQIEQIRGEAPTQEIVVPTDTMEVAPTPTATTTPPNTKVAEELSYLRLAVGEVRAAFQELRNNQDTSKESILKLNLKEAKSTLKRRLQELTPAMRQPGGDVDTVQAIDEAEKLLIQVENVTL
eukprot:TRINITY_DN3711_c0_g1_i5.p1 TRINITY_DN3711_c0_g1~~TRINITY_DN3711_c0_g1_i5.p1  ORF type:complete len:255 (-),score=42.69 TRINITY_DN3711_c0_g1_i5:191-955(-)